jgi:hypothetical protein
MKLHAEFFLLMIGFNVFVFLCVIHNGDYQFDYWANVPTCTPPLFDLQKSVTCLVVFEPPGKEVNHVHSKCYKL